MASEALDQPRAEQRDGRVAQRFGMRDEVITVAVIERSLERPDEATLFEILGEQERVAECNTLPTQRILNRQDRRVEHETALVFDAGYAILTDKLRPQVMPGQICDPHVHNFVRLDK